MCLDDFSRYGLYVYVIYIFIYMTKIFIWFCIENIEFL